MKTHPINHLLVLLLVVTHSLPNVGAHEDDRFSQRLDISTNTPRIVSPVQNSECDVEVTAAAVTEIFVGTIVSLNLDLIDAKIMFSKTPYKNKTVTFYTDTIIVLRNKMQEFQNLLDTDKYFLELVDGGVFGKRLELADENVYLHDLMSCDELCKQPFDTDTDFSCHSPLLDEDDAKYKIPFAAYVFLVARLTQLDHCSPDDHMSVVLKVRNELETYHEWSDIKIAFIDAAPGRTVLQFAYSNDHWLLS